MSDWQRTEIEKVHLITLYSSHTEGEERRRRKEGYVLTFKVKQERQKDRKADWPRSETETENQSTPGVVPRISVAVGQYYTPLPPPPLPPTKDFNYKSRAGSNDFLTTLLFLIFT